MLWFVLLRNSPFCQNPVAKVKFIERVFATTVLLNRLQILIIFTNSVAVSDSRSDGVGGP